MGNYIFSARALLNALKADALRPESKHDFGHDILPSLLGNASIYAYDYQTNVIPGEALRAPVYWRDVGTLEAYFDAQMDLCGLVPSLNLYNQHWPIHTASYPDPSAKFTFDEEGAWHCCWFHRLRRMHSCRRDSPGLCARSKYSRQRGSRRRRIR